MTAKTKPFNISAHLNSPEEIRLFLQEVLETGTEADFIHALSIAAKAKGMTQVAEKAGVTRASLYKSLAENGNPRFTTISKVTKALGFKLTLA
ncbi:MAG: putative addiction module antidote protein [Desulfobacterales bacterium]|nr:putative addiction module antidote protein [Desulfobacterales bacterium]